MFGFPEKITEWEAVHWLRIFAIIAGYLVIRKWIVSLFDWIQKRQLDKEKKEEERVQEEQVKVKMDQMSELRQRKVAAAKKAGINVDEYEEYDMPSDDDVSDLLGGL